MSQKRKGCLSLLVILIVLTLNGRSNAQASTNGSCVAAGFINCCSLGNTASCYGLPKDCYCDHICYEFNDCCTDIGSICAGTVPSDYGTCAAMNYKNCCTPGTNASLSCHGSDGVCFCDQSCHLFGDCCTDIEQYCPSVNPSSTLAPTVSPTVNPGDGSCITAGHLSCCVPSSSNTCTGSNGLCSCSADCYDSGNCCNDISQIGCATPTPIDSPCTAAGYNQCCHPQIYNGSCSGNPPGCYCDQLCFSFGDCCSDVTDIGCILLEPSVIPPAPNGSCVAKYQTCCQPSANNSCLGYPSNCYCDAQCHNYGDCCNDIADIGCNSVQSSCAPHYTSCCIDEDLTCVGSPEPNCYCDQACALRDDCCYDQSQLKECTEPTVPGPVNNLMAMAASPNSFYVMWDLPTHPNGVSHYIINVSNYSGEGDNRLRVQLTIHVLEEIVTQLLPFKPYNVTVYGINIDGKGIRRTVINFTQEGIPTQAPDNVRITRSGTTLTVSWSPLSLEAARGFPMYMVQYFPSTNLNQIVTLNTTGTSVTISNVNARISYGVKVAAFTKGGIGSLSKTAYEGGLFSPCPSGTHSHSGSMHPSGTMHPTGSPSGTHSQSGTMHPSGTHSHSGSMHTSGTIMHSSSRHTTASHINPTSTVTPMVVTDKDTLSVIVRGYTTKSFKEDKRSNFKKATMYSVNDYCSTHSLSCEGVGIRSKRDSTNIDVSNVKIYDYKNGASDSIVVRLYVQLGPTTILSKDALQKSIKSGTDNYKHLNFTSVEVSSTTIESQPTSDQNNNNSLLSFLTILGIIVGIMFVILLVTVGVLIVVVIQKKQRRPNQYEAVEISERLLNGNRAQLQFDDDDDDDDDNGGVKGVSYANLQMSQDDDEQRYTASRPRESTPF